MKLSVRIFLFIFALNLVSMGISLYLKADIGIGSWDVLNNNLAQFYRFSFGTWVFIVGIITILVSQLLYFRLYNFLAIIPGLIMGLLIDMWLIIFHFQLDNIYLQFIIFFLALILLGSGISLLVLTKLPPTPADILMLSLMKCFKTNFFVARTTTDALALISGIIVGAINNKPLNNIGIGTLLALLFVGSIVQVTSRFWKKLLKQV